ncbi:MAG: lipoate--protein ligase family protein [Candidatus Cohnella colombiensis]|uniref:Lipoate--protein ligase family protein n=1 Tax=Candidatus Cohnella colombiensis TaxID=3121368 RepID=A0AA95EW33_9BACL|nr:MAG: lipoate--protein ligase family protein [Cohnella sp.]
MNTINWDWATDIRIIDRTAEGTTSEIVRPFAIDELLCQQVAAEQLPICHLWRHPRAFVMGTKDSRLPGVSQAIDTLEEAGYEVLVRNSGGAAVPLDEGVINISLILPLNTPYAYGFRNDFELMYMLIQEALAHLGFNVQRGEVHGSYCPGDYDLHLEGYKFCGIAQRRKVNAFIIQAFVNVEGSGEGRASLVKSFYEQAGIGATAHADYPVVQPDRMISLQQYKPNIRATDFINSIKQTLQSHQSLKYAKAESDSRIALPDSALIDRMCERLLNRYPLPR